VFGIFSLTSLTGTADMETGGFEWSIMVFGDLAPVESNAAQLGNSTIKASGQLKDNVLVVGVMELVRHSLADPLLK
jgi:hypothetical protein